jgi:putative AdoMet-dependent methyltransferase
MSIIARLGKRGNRHTASLAPRPQRGNWVSDRRRIQLFDEWAERYDACVQCGAGLHEGYEEVLAQVARDAGANAGMRVLDLGIGTGNLAQRFLDLGCEVWGTDFSPGMLAKARAKVPQVRLLAMDLLAERWPEELAGQRFQRIVSSYVFHEFDLTTKVKLIARLGRDHLAQGGRIVIGDLAFPDRQALEEAGADHWDEDEHYWEADKAIAAGGKAGLAATYTQVSPCAGVFVVRPMSASQPDA